MTVSRRWLGKNYISNTGAYAIAIGCAIFPTIPLGPSVDLIGGAPASAATL